MSHIISFPKEQSDLLKSAALIITIETGEKFYHLPYFYKDLGDNKYEVFRKDELPDDMKDIINPYKL